MEPAESTLDQLLKARQAIDKQLREHQVSLTILFTDVVGSTAYFERYGDLAGVALMHQHARLGEEVVNEFGGRVIKTIGDSVMAEFPKPAPGVRAAMELQRRLLQMNQGLQPQDRLQLRIGLNHGPCVRAGNDVFGDAVNLSARVTKKTGPAQILISRSVREAISSEADLRCTYIGAVALSGKAEKEDIYEIVWTETGEYRELRENVTSALKRGDLMSPGLKIEDLAPPPPPEPVTPAPPPRTGEIVTSLPTADVPSSSKAAAPLNERYEILGELGQGGMGVVYKARDRETSDLVALKVLRSEIAADTDGLARFKNELRIARRITHKNICRIHEFSRAENSAYISMEFVEGESLRSIINRKGAMTPEEIIPIIKQICAGLGEAHAQGVVHRDLKPENVMVDPTGTVKVMDFGIARSELSAGMTQTGSVVGTPAYMAPEQAQGEHLDNRTDIYALGLILYEMFAGVQAFRAPTPVAIVLKHISEIPTPPRTIRASIPDYIESAILRCLEKKPDARFQNIEEVAAALSYSGADARPLSTGGLATAEALALAGQGTGTVVASPAAFRTPAPVPVAAKAPVAPAAQKIPIPVARDSTKMLGIVIGAILVVGLGGAFVVFKLLRNSAPQNNPAPTVDGTVPVPGPAPVPNDPVTKPNPSGITPPVQPEPAPPGPSGGTTASSGGIEGSWDGTLAGEGDSGRFIIDFQKSANGYSGRLTIPSMKINNAPLTTVVATGSDVLFDFNRGGDDAPLVFESKRSGDKINGTLRTVGEDQVKFTLVRRGGGGATAPAPGLAPLTSINFALQSTLPGHTGSVNAVAISPDGRLVATASDDRSVRVWDAQSGQQLQKLTGHVDAVIAVAFAGDNNTLASAGRDKSIRIWNAHAGGAGTVLPKDNAIPTCLVFDRNILFAGNSDGLVKVFDVGSGRLAQAPLEEHQGAIYSVAVSGDGDVLVTSGRDGVVRIRRRESSQPFDLRGHSGPVNAVAVSRDGKRAASAGEDGTVKLYDAVSGKELRTLSGHSGAVNGVAMSPDGRWVASAGDDRNIKVWDVATGKELATLPGHISSLTKIVASRDGKSLVTSSGDKTAKIWKRTE